ncbi:hypothetical protein HDU85_005147 [Gaertneriomyces sp. JEL0708]|nr:hypothetical protein HDU85_005147 [Gaertneriomyces sp. JEL0708]
MESFHRRQQQQQQQNASQMEQYPPYSAAESVFRFLATSEPMNKADNLPPSSSAALDDEFSFLNYHQPTSNSMSFRDLDLGRELESRFNARFAAELGLDLPSSYGDLNERATYQTGMLGRSLPNYSNFGDNMNDTAASVIRPFLSDFPSPHAHDSTYRNQGPNNLPINGFKDFRPQHAFDSHAAARILDDLDLHRHSQQYKQPYTTVPPPGYICKLCFVEGHWLRNCNLYKERRQQTFLKYMKQNPLAAFLPPSLLDRAGQPTKTTIPPDG